MPFKIIFELKICLFLESNFFFDDSWHFLGNFFLRTVIHDIIMKKYAKMKCLFVTFHIREVKHFVA